MRATCPARITVFDFIVLITLS